MENVRLMSGPDSGVTVAERVPHQLPANPHNARYLDTKRDRAGHLL